MHSPVPATLTDRFHQLLLIATFTAFSWLTFMVVHEFGHVVAAWVTGGSITHVVLHPLEISWSAFEPNPRPLLVAWGGPVLGSLLPLIGLAIARMTRMRGFYLVQFFAGFCLVANGVYLAIDAFERGGDGKALLLHGAAQWHLILFAALTTPGGFWLWHGLGPHFGLGVARGRVDHGAAIASACLLVLVAGLEVLFSS